MTKKIKSSWRDKEEATEYGATGVAILLTLELTEYTTLHRAMKGKGFDYWVGIGDYESKLPFQEKARLEVSGIRNGTNRDIQNRINKKTEQTKISDGIKIPTFIVVVEFSQPKAHFIKR